MDQSEAADKTFLGIGVHRCPIGGFSFLVSLVFSLWFAFLIGRDLGLFFGGLILASILAALLVIAESDLLRRLSIQFGVVCGITIVWLSCVFNDTITLGEWFRVSLVLLIYTYALAAVAALIAKIRIPPAV